MVIKSRDQIKGNRQKQMVDYELELYGILSLMSWYTKPSYQDLTEFCSRSFFPSPARTKGVDVDK